MESPARIDVEKEFAHCVRAIGGRVLDDELQGSRKPTNADYWFPEFNVVAELKRLSEDLMTSREFQKKVADRYSGWVRKGLVPRPVHGEKVFIEFGKIPEVCANEIADLLKRKIEPALAQANRQIKETKKLLRTPEATSGLLILVNDGNHAHTPDMMRYLLGRIMGSKFKAIGAVIYFSANERVEIPGIAVDSRFWIDWVLDRGPEVPETLRITLRDQWLRHVSSKIKGPIMELYGPADPKSLAKIQFSKK
jgi:hypothetical protein